MSVTGPQYKYDVFFSYAWAEKSGGTFIGDWSVKFAEAVIILLQAQFNFGSDPDLRFSYFLDRESSNSGEDINKTLKEAVEQSAIFIAMVSPHYNSPYCLKELDWFCSSLEDSTDSERLVVLQVQKTRDADWPERLKASERPLLFRSLADQDGLPKGFADFVAEQRLVGLAKLISEAALEISEKISVLRKRRETQQQHAQFQQPPDSPLLFLEAEPSDRTRWEECRQVLNDVPSIVLPTGIPKAATDICTDDDLLGCFGILMLRSRHNDDFGRRIKSAYLHRQKLYRGDNGHELGVEYVRWYLLDDLEQAPLEQNIYKIPRIRLEGDWLSRLQEAMRC